MLIVLNLHESLCQFDIGAVEIRVDTCTAVLYSVALGTAKLSIMYRSVKLNNQ